jgi:hypothetical protein
MANASAGTFVLGLLRDEDAMSFKKSVYDECTMISVAVRRIILIILSALIIQDRLQLLRRLPLRACLWIH